MRGKKKKINKNVKASERDQENAFSVTVCSRKPSPCSTLRTVLQEASDVKDECACVCVCVDLKGIASHQATYYSNKHDMLTSPKQARGVKNVSLVKSVQKKENLLFHRNFRENIQLFHSKSPPLELQSKPSPSSHRACLTAIL